MTEPKLTATQEQVVRTIKNLRKLTLQTGTRTTYTQNELLRALSPTDLAAVANCLASE